MSVNDNLWREDEKTGWGCWVDEYYTFFPDGTGIRKAMWQKGSLGRPRQFQESIPLTHPGQLQGDVIYPDYVTIANLLGETQVFSYIEDPPKETEKFIPQNPLIQRHNFKSKAKPFIIFEKGSRMHYLKDMNITSLSKPGSCSHWPVGQVPSDGRTTQAVDRASSFLGFPITDPVVHEGPDSRNWVNSLYGMTEKPMEELVVLAKSWAQAPELKIVSGAVTNRGYDMSQRTYKLENMTPSLPLDMKCLLCADDEFPIKNVCLSIKGWGSASAELTFEGEKLVPGSDLELGYIRTIEGTDLVVWIAKTSNRPVRISLKPAAIPQ